MWVIFAQNCPPRRHVLSEVGPWVILRDCPPPTCIVSNVGHFKEVSSSERRIRRFGQKFDGHNMPSCLLLLLLLLLWTFFERTDLFDFFVLFKCRSPFQESTILWFTCILFSVRYKTFTESQLQWSSKLNGVFFLLAHRLHFWSSGWGEVCCICGLRMTPNTSVPYK